MNLATTNWKLVGARGVAALLFGFIAFLWPSLTLGALAMLFGAYTIVDGLLAIGIGARSASTAHAWTFGLEGLLGVALGLVAMGWTRAAITFVVYGIGPWALTTGALELLAARALRSLGPAATMLRVGGVLSLLLGFVVLLAPYASATAFVVVLASYELTFGAAMLGHSMDLRRHEPRGPGEVVGTRA
jgi:uncharacterized membrane protein HdeD (DUF308 family)